MEHKPYTYSDQLYDNALTILSVARTIRKEFNEDDMANMTLSEAILLVGLAEISYTSTL